MNLRQHSTQSINATPSQFLFLFLSSMHTCTDKGGDFSPFHSIVYVHSPPTYSLRAPIGSHDYLSYINSLGFLFMFCSSLTNSAKLSIATVMLCKFTIVCRTIKTIVNLLYLLLYLASPVTRGQRWKLQTLLAVLAVHRPFHISICISTGCLRSTLRLFFSLSADL